ncbi:MAG: trypsin-like peptidase domain-containing protein [Bacteroidales bacterium]|nr:trypsin-like peptidase domain-containing protein [Bacteroidales bacterium]
MAHISYISSLLIFLVISFSSRSQEAKLPETLRQAQQNVCAIKILTAEGQASSLGCGVVIKSKVNQQSVYFVATAWHIVSSLISEDGRSATVHVFDQNGYFYKTGALTSKNVIWWNRSMDAALMVLPANIEPGEPLPQNYESPGLASLKMIGDPEWGQEIYMFGYRWINENKFIDIVKKGILSVGTTELPGYENHLVYLIDNMANKGMSGGLAFTSDGTGIGIISSYVYESGDRYLNSDDLSVCLPLTFFFESMNVVINKGGEAILRIVNP